MSLLHFIFLTPRNQLYDRKLSYRFVYIIYFHTTLFVLFSDLTVYFSTQQQLLSVHNKCLNFCLSILLILTENQNSQNILMVNTSADYMKRVLNPTSDDFPFDPTTMICLFDLLWNGLLTNEANLKCFVKSGSVYALIDLIEVYMYGLYLFYFIKKIL